MTIYNWASNTSNPQKELKLSEILVHDPFVFACNDTKTYYLYTSGSPRFTDLNRDGVLMYISENLIDWEGPFVVFEVPDGTWANPTHGIWTPEVHLYQEKYFLFVTLHNKESLIEADFEAFGQQHARGTAIAVADSLEEPFTLIKKDGPIPPENFMTLDGTLYLEDGKPWMVYCHEWIQIIDGTFEAIPLKSDLTAAVGEPIHLFKASDAPWIYQEKIPSNKRTVYVSDGCQLYKTKSGSLVMLWSSYNNEGYVQTIARSKSGKLYGPWEQLDPLVQDDSGHGMMFQTFEGVWLLILHQPFAPPYSRAKIYEMVETEESFTVVRSRSDLDYA
ncbi:glycoside hydrolase family 43 protein [Gracilibacillus alcaliphilus]|uniref:glycoside hydrolase family 43 protein n=1 Tax=Gracilibacillus alcaliphilus TaxID=1401441 RepID=UPI0019589FC8|nr:glycoside hydrolase family 43 protein [Gracilibacillus alcaliphilus]